MLKCSLRETCATINDPNGFRVILPAPSSRHHACATYFRTQSWPFQIWAGGQDFLLDVIQNTIALVGVHFFPLTPIRSLILLELWRKRRTRHAKLAVPSSSSVAMATHRPLELGRNKEKNLPQFHSQNRYPSPPTTIPFLSLLFSFLCVNCCFFVFFLPL